MAKLEGLVAFRAALIVKRKNLYHIVDEVYANVKHKKT
jgi:hypothetical protein